MTTATAYTHTTLPNLVGIVGTFSFKLYTEFDGLTTPTEQTILTIGDTKESANIKAGTTEVENVKMQIRDDYTNYTYGFWYKILSGEAWLKILLDGNYYFFGTVQADTVHWNEFYMSGSTKIRTCSFTLVAMTQKLFDTTTADWLTEAYTNRELTGYVASTPAYAVISLTGLFSALLSASGVNSTYEKADTGFVASATNKDLEWSDGSSWYALNFVWLLVTYDSGGGETKVDYFDSASGNYLASKYALAKELLAGLLKNFGLVMRVYYDPSVDRHKISLFQYRAYDDANNLDFSNREKQSDLSRSTDIYVDAVRCTSIYNDEFVWWSRRYYSGAQFSEAAPPNYITFDLDEYLPYLVYGTAPDTSGYPIYVGSLATTVAISTSVRYFRYDGVGVVVASATQHRKMLEAISGLLFSRFTTVLSAINRSYGKMLAKVGAGSDTPTSLTIMRRTSINDGLGTVTYWANTVIKKPMTSEVEIHWLKE